MEDNHVNEPLESYGRPANFDQVWLMFQETAKEMKETDRQMKETDKKIKALSDLFTGQWGKLVESLVEGDLVKLLREKRIKIEHTIQRIKGNRDGENYEYDIIAVNGEEIVIVEVKTTLRVDDVDDFHRKVWKAKQYMPEYKSKKVYGGVAFITSEGSSERMAEKMGFFVIRATGSSATIINSKDFTPKIF